MGEAMKTLADYMRESETDPFLRMGPPSPNPEDVYRDFSLMPIETWMEMIQVIGQGNVKIIAGARRGNQCRAQLWITPDGQRAWAAYLDGARQ